MSPPRRAIVPERVVHFHIAAEFYHGHRDLLTMLRYPSFSHRPTIMAPIGFRILPFAPQPPPKLIGAPAPLATALLSDNMHRLHAIGPDLRPFHRGGKLVGTALTVKVGPATT